MLKTTLALALVNGAMGQGQSPADIRWQTASDCYQREMVAAGVSIFSELRLFFSIQDTPLHSPALLLVSLPCTA
tara:strand:- start:390 stop:611 length:222 start_codon:yes stop_codon:yes gene_type:complete